MHAYAEEFVEESLFGGGWNAQSLDVGVWRQGLLERRFELCAGDKDSLLGANPRADDVWVELGRRGISNGDFARASGGARDRRWSAKIVASVSCSSSTAK